LFTINRSDEISHAPAKDGNTEKLFPEILIAPEDTFLPNREDPSEAILKERKYLSDNE